jgi:site-specific recombinase XerD
LTSSPVHAAIYSRFYVRQLLPRLARRAGIEKRVHAHGLRHTHALDLVTAGATITDDLRT